MGLIHIYCGNGKGKTTAALGLAIRSAGAGMKVHFVQLLKGGATSELNTLKLIPNITVSRCDKDYGFTFKMSQEERDSITKCHNSILSNALTLAQNGETDILVIDEFCGAYECGLVDRKLAQNLVFQKPERLELVLTGRNPAECFTEIADYVSEIKLVKHPYESGISARKGIEY